MSVVSLQDLNQLIEEKRFDLAKEKLSLIDIAQIPARSLLYLAELYIRLDETNHFSYLLCKAFEKAQSEAEHNQIRAFVSYLKSKYPMQPQLDPLNLKNFSQFPCFSHLPPVEVETLHSFATLQSFDAQTQLHPNSDAFPFFAVLVSGHAKWLAHGKNSEKTVNLGDGFGKAWLLKGNSSGSTLRFFTPCTAFVLNQDLLGHHIAKLPQFQQRVKQLKLQQKNASEDTLPSSYRINERFSTPGCFLKTEGDERWRVLNASSNGILIKPERLLQLEEPVDGTILGRSDHPIPIKAVVKRNQDSQFYGLQLIFAHQADQDQWLTFLELYREDHPAEAGGEKEVMIDISPALPGMVEANQNYIKVLVKAIGSRHLVFQSQHALSDVATLKLHTKFKNTENKKVELKLEGRIEKELASQEYLARLEVPPPFFKETLLELKNTYQKDKKASSSDSPAPTINLDIISKEDLLRKYQFELRANILTLPPVGEFLKNQKVEIRILFSMEIVRTLHLPKHLILSGTFLRRTDEGPFLFKIEPVPASFHGRMEELLALQKDANASNFFLSRNKKVLGLIAFSCLGLFLGLSLRTYLTHRIETDLMRVKVPQAQTYPTLFLQKRDLPDTRLTLPESLGHKETRLNRLLFVRYDPSKKKLFLFFEDGISLEGSYDIYKSFPDPLKNKIIGLEPALRCQVRPELPQCKVIKP